MIDVTSKAIFHGLAQAPFLQRQASRYGMRPRGFARRFIAGESIIEAIGAVQALPAKGLRLTLDYLGESVSSGEAAAAAATDYVGILDAVVNSGVERNVSLKLTQLGLDVDRATAIDNMRRILEPADHFGFFVRIDMEGSAYTEITLQVLETLWRRPSQHRHRDPVVPEASGHAVAAERARRARAPGEGRHKEPKTVASTQARRRRGLRRSMRLLMIWTGSGDRHARSGDDRGDEGACGGKGHGKIASSSDAVRHSPGPAGVTGGRWIHRASTCRSTPVLRISCGALASGRRTCGCGEGRADRSGLVSPRRHEEHEVSFQTQVAREHTSASRQVSTD
jgi:hypothetical protein